MRLRKHGFTLIELLVVIALIALLAALLFPMLLRAQEQGRISSCASNMRQIYTALTMYLDHYNGFMPTSGPINFCASFEYPGQPIELDDARKDNQDNPRFQIHFLLMEYVVGKPTDFRTSYDSCKVFRCPTDSVTPPVDANSGLFKTTTKQYELCAFAKYGSSYQWRLGQEQPFYTGNTSPDGAQGTDLLSGRCISGFPKLSKLGAARDAQSWHSYSYTHTRKDWRDPSAAGNVLFLDGHVKYSQGGEFLSGIY